LVLHQLLPREQILSSNTERINTVVLFRFVYLKKMFIYQYTYFDRMSGRKWKRTIYIMPELNLQIILVSAILTASLILLVTEKIAVDKTRHRHYGCPGNYGHPEPC